MKVICFMQDSNIDKKILIACEFSGVVTNAFRDLGYEAFSCDLEPTEGNPDWHIQGDVIELIYGIYETDDTGKSIQIKKPVKFGKMVGFPPCTHLAVSGSRWFPEKIKDGRQQEAIDFFMALVNAPIEQIAIENPVGIMSSIYRKPDQYIQPYEHGEPYIKKTGLWLKNLPKLRISNKIFPSLGSKMWNQAGEEKQLGWNTPEIKRFRNIFPKGVAKAMAEQWGHIYQKQTAIDEYFNEE